MQTIAISAGVRLTPLELEDSADLFALTDANRAHLRAWLPWLDGVRRVEDTRAFIRTAERQAARDDGRQFAVRVDGAIAGIFGHLRRDWRTRHTARGG
ncbi:MAG: RimJ/RimL family protein N-acetyltransferase, partial [Acidobacteria bacterium]|nr:RimJ/RimL family protein N-acetyltransferase [Acidobacteriota bacterium]